jgi:hypothetical protein
VTAPAWRHARWWVIVVGVVLAHGAATHWLGEQLLALDARQAGSMRRMQAAYVRELRPTAPPAVTAPRPWPPRKPPPVARADAPAPGDEAASQPRRPPRGSQLAAAASAPSRPTDPMSAPEAASAPADPASATAGPGPAPGDAASAPAQPASAPPAFAGPGASASPASVGAEAAAADAASAPAAAAVAQAAPDAASSSPVTDAAAQAAEADAAASFAWPASTRIRYILTGQFRGEVHGSAEVQWLRDGDRYQIHLEAFIGPRVAPLGSRRLSSAGRTTPEGLQPELYEQETRLLLSEPRQLRMAFDAATVTLSNGTRLLRTPGMQDLQDTASQFVQLVWLFRTQPGRLEVGRPIEFTLALPRRVQRWTYDVVARDTVPTPAGAVEAFHVKPRRDAGPGDLTTEMWFAPALQYLPVRLMIRQDSQTYVDLAMQGLPEQAER